MDKLKEYAKFAVEETVKLLGIDSPTGYTKEAALWVLNEFKALGFEDSLTNKGGVLVDLGGKDKDNALFLEAHVDTLGGMVSEIKGNGRLKITNLGGMNANNAEAENVKVYTRSGKIYEGTFQLMNPSIHVNTSYNDIKRSFDSCEVVLDEDVNSKDEVIKLGISVGDIVAFDPRTRITEKGYIKSRFLDDKLSVGILLGFAKCLSELNIDLRRKIYAHITVYEEVGHGGSASIPKGVTEAISVDMGCVGDGLSCKEKQVSICVKDSGGPYSYELIDKLILAAKNEKADYALDVYPAYGSDVESSLRAGNDIRHGLIGAGVYASHGYERSHVDGVLNSIKVLKGYIELD